MIHLRRLQLSHFRSLSGTAELDFPPSGLVQLCGKNRNTGGSSGSGKSNLLMALQYALAQPTPAAKLLQSLHDEEDMQVCLELVDEHGAVATLQRGRKVSLAFAGKTHQGASAFKEQLPRVLGLPPELLGAITVRRQRSGSYLLGLDDSNKKEFLVQVIPELERYSAMAEDAAARGAAMLKEQEGVRRELAGAEANASASAPEQPKYEDLAPLVETARRQTELVRELSERVVADESLRDQAVKGWRDAAGAVPTRPDYRQDPRALAILQREVPEALDLESQRARLAVARTNLAAASRLAAVCQQVAPAAGIDRHVFVTDQAFRFD